MQRYLLPILLLVVLTTPPARAQEGPQEQTLRPLTLAQTISDSLAASDVHIYSIDLAAEQFVFGVAEQQTVDVVVTVYDPTRRVVGTFDGPASGPETFQFDTQVAGTYRIEVKPFEEGAGRYTVAVQRVEPVATIPGERVDQLMAAYDREDVPGGVVAVMRDGAMIFAEAYGMANLTHAVPFTTETLSNIGSTSKQFTAFAIVLLAERGQLSLDDDVRTHIPELPDFGETVTLRHLLTHTSGYREFLNTLVLTGRRIDAGDYIDRDELIAIVQQQPALQNTPGAEWNYNNTGFGLLTVVVERVTGQSFPEWMDEQVFEPLGMAHTVVRADPAQIIPNSAQGYLPAEDGGYREASDLDAAMGAGGIYTTVGDLARWIENLHTGAVGGKAIIQEMTTPYVLADGDTTNYGLGLFLDEQRGLKRVQHGGADIAHRSMLMYFPSIKAGVVVLSNNSAFTGSIPQQVAEAFFEDYMEPEDTEDAAEASTETEAFDPATYDPEAFDALAGQYELEAAAGFILTFTREDDQFFIQATGQPRVEITPTSDSTFALSVVDAQIMFHIDEDGTAEMLTLHQNGHHLARRLKEEPWAPSEEDLAAYTGRYYSEELETFYTLAIEDSGLVVQHRRYDSIALTPAKKDTFNGSFPIGEVVFERDEAGQVTGFTVSNVRTRGVRFDKQE